MDKDKFKQITKDVMEVLSEKGMLPEANTFAEIVTRIYNSENINKKERKQKDSATEKQIKFLKDLGVDVKNKTFSKYEAKKLIEEKTKK